MHLRKLLFLSTALLSSTIGIATSSHSALSIDNGNPTPRPSSTNTPDISLTPRHITRPNAPFRQTMAIRSGMFLQFDQIHPGSTYQQPFEAWDIIGIISQVQSFAMDQVLLRAQRAPINNPRGVSVPEFEYTVEATAQMFFAPMYIARHQSQVFSRDLEYMAKQLVFFIRNYQVRDTRILLMEGNAAHGPHRVVGQGSLLRKGED